MSEIILINRLVEEIRIAKKFINPYKVKKGRIKLHKEMSQVETNSRLVDMNPTISVILLNENGLNFSYVKRLGLPD